MNHSIHVPRWPRRAGPPAARTAVAVIATAALALLAAACGGGGSPAGSGGASPVGGSSSSATSARLVVFSRCMRSHGVPLFPDPEPGQTEIKLPAPHGQPVYRVSSSRFNSALSACEVFTFQGDHVHVWADTAAAVRGPALPAGNPGLAAGDAGQTIP